MKINENLPKNKFLRTAMLGMMLLLSGCGAAGNNGNVAQQAAADNQKMVAESTQTDVIEATEVEAVATEFSENTELQENTEIVVTLSTTEVTLSLADIPEYSGEPYVAVNDNVPQFLETDLSTDSYEYYSDLEPRTLWRRVCLHRHGFDADRRARQHRFGDADRLAYGKI